MRVAVWWAARNAGVVRRVVDMPLVGPLVRRAGYLILPSETRELLTLRSGIGEGLRLELNPRWEQRMWQGTYEPKVQKILADFCRRGRVIYDVGGGLGFYSLAAVRSGATVFTFEPDPANRASIERHASLNGLSDRINVLPLAAFSRTGTLSMEPSKEGHGRGHAYAREVWQSDDGERFDAACTTLDDFARTHVPPDLIKIDAEGCEAEVMRGAQRLMRDGRSVILCEVHDDDLANETERLARASGYQISWVTDDGYHVRWLHATPAGSTPCAA